MILKATVNYLLYGPNVTVEIRHCNGRQYQQGPSYKGLAFQ